MAQQNINTGTLPNDKTGDSLRTAMIKVQNNFTELYTTAPISNSVNVGNTTSNVLANSTTVFIGNSGTYTLANSTSITTTSGYYSQVLNSGSNNLVIGTTNATSILVYTNGISSANQRAIVAANGNVGIGNGAPNELLTVGGTLSANQLIIGNTTVNFTINATFIPATANYALTSNTTNFVGSVSAANVVSNAQLSANLANYTNTAGLTSYVAGATANNTSFVGSVSAANVVSNAQLSANLSNYTTTTSLSSNLANYQTTAGLSANVATLTSNNTSFVGSVSAANVVSNAQLSSNLSNYTTTSALSSNLANYQTTAGLSGNVANLTANNATYAFSKSENNLNVNSASYATTAGSASSMNASNLSGGTVPASVMPTGSRTLLNTLTASNSGTLQDTSNITGSYRHYEFELEDIIPTSSAVIYARFYVSGAWQTSNYGGAGMASNAGTAAFSSGDATQIKITGGANQVNGSSTDGLSGLLRLSNPSSTSVYKKMWGQGVFWDTNPLLSGWWTYATYRGSTAAVTGIQFYFSGQNISSGIIRIFGVK